MSAVGNPYDNAKAESLFKTLKREEVYLNHYQTFRDAEENLGHFVGDVYNAKRLHSSLGYLPPFEFEAHDGHLLREKMVDFERRSVFGVQSRVFQLRLSGRDVTNFVFK